MRKFHIGDVLSITTGRLVSPRHIGGIYDILNFMTGDDLFTHQLPRAMKECQPWLLAQYPTLTKEALGASLDAALEAAGDDKARQLDFITNWLITVGRDFTGGVYMLPVHPLGEGMHTHVNPLEELEAMVGKDRIIAVKLGEEPDHA